MKNVFSGPTAAHCFALTSDGRCFSWGRNETGELGHGHVTNVYLPKEVPSLPEGEVIIGGACGARHSLVFSAAGKLYSAGHGSSGQC